jgi:hypothetical protein
MQDYKESELYRAEIYKNRGYAFAAFIGAFILHIYLVDLTFDYKLLIRIIMAIAFLVISISCIEYSYTIIKKEENRINATTNPRRDH